MKREVTSAIPNMTVGEVRKHLDCLRQQWRHAGSEPFYLTNPMPNTEMSVQTFALLFVRGQHQKRHNKEAKNVR